MLVFCESAKEARDELCLQGCGVSTSFRNESALRPENCWAGKMPGSSARRAVDPIAMRPTQCGRCDLCGSQKYASTMAAPSAKVVSSTMPSVSLHGTEPRRRQLSASAETPKPYPLAHGRRRLATASREGAQNCACCSHYRNIRAKVAIRLGNRIVICSRALRLDWLLGCVQHMPQHYVTLSSVLLRRRHQPALTS